ncbi:MAG: twin-arginine translocase subunit TatC [Thermoprotei archaeon]|jgi:sec-independent protein translocase protein TatC
MVKDKEMTLLEHLEELRQRLKVIITSLVISTAIFLIFPANPYDLLNPETWVSGLYKPLIGEILIQIKNYVAPANLRIISLGVGAPLEIYLLASLLFGFIVTSPVIGYEIYKYVDPALYPHERQAIYPFVTAFTVLFIIGALFGFFILAPFVVWTVIPFSQFVGSEPVLSVSDFYSVIFATVAFSGIGFTFPAIFVLLVRLGITDTSIITKNRKYFYAALYIITAIITPDGGPLADLALFIPMAVMMEITVHIAKKYEKQRIISTTEKSMSTVRSCKFCGYPLKNDEIFCPKCGKSQI